MDNILESVLSRLDVKIRSSVITVISRVGKINEIRIRENSNVFVTFGTENIKCDYIVDREALNNTFERLCSGTLHTHLETIKNGYITLPEGVRIGVCGRAVCENGVIKNVYDISSLCIRIPYPVYGVSEKIMEKIRSNDFYISLLIYSLPSVGKTTMIRDLAYRLANEENKRVCVIDSRCEIVDSRLKGCSIDLYSSYPKAYAMELAVRTMNPQYIICDEIGTFDDLDALLSVQNSGVPVIATAHSRNIIELMRRPCISRMHENGVFDMYVGIRRNQQNKIAFSFCSYNEVTL